VKHSIIEQVRDLMKFIRMHRIRLETIEESIKEFESYINDASTKQ